MPLRNAYRLRWQPKGLSDALDGNNSFPGSMRILQNLVPAASTDMSFYARPASILKNAFGTFTTPGFISSELVVGDIAYGTIASGRNAGKDEPFAYNIKTNTFLTVTGITNANSPTQLASSGDWIPPIVAQVASRIMVTHQGFPGGAIKIGWFDVSGFTSSTITGTTHNTTTTIDTLSANPLAAGFQPGMTISDASGDIPANTTIVSLTTTTITISQAATGGHAANTLTVTGGTAASPQWGAGDLNLNNLPSVPQGVAQFNGRAYYACGLNGVVFSDSGLPTNRTNANQALTPNNGLAVTVLGQQMLSAPLTGGIVQALIAFQGVAAMQQIQGDPTTTNLSMNLLPVATGTNSPLSVTPTQFGLSFISPEGLRFVRFDGSVTEPIGDHGEGVTVPFINTPTPSRTCAAANADTIRITVLVAGLIGGVNYVTQFQEFWFDITRKIWTGPHTFPASLIQPWNNTFLMAPAGVNNSLWQSDAVPTISSGYIENGAPITWVYQTSLVPDDEDMKMVSISEASLTITQAGSSAVVTAFDDFFNALDTATFPIQPAVLWGGTTWGGATWSGNPELNYRQRPMQFKIPLVAKQMYFQVVGTGAPFFQIGNLSLRYQRRGYQVEVA